MEQIELKVVDKIEITVLVDNYTDVLLPDDGPAKRLRVQPPAAPKAEHGLSYLIKVTGGDQSHTLMMDAGVSGECLNHNAEMMSISLGALTGTFTADIRQTEGVVLSHGHFDHFAGLAALLDRFDKEIPLIVHPGAFVERRLNQGPGMILNMPKLEESELARQGATLDLRSGPSTLASGMMLLTGKVERTTDFEKGVPALEANINGQWVSDPFYDDQALAVHLRDKGIVVIGGCSHAGIINTVRHIQKLTGTREIYAVMGGFHLSGPGEAVIENTVREMKKIDPAYIVPMHCTGWKAMNRFSETMPERFILNSVGTTYVFPS